MSWTKDHETETSKANFAIGFSREGQHHSTVMGIVVAALELMSIVIAIVKNS